MPLVKNIFLKISLYRLKDAIKLCNSTYHDYEIHRQTEGECCLQRRRWRGSHGADTPHATEEQEDTRANDLRREHCHRVLLHLPCSACKNRANGFRRLLKSRC